MLLAPGTRIGSEQIMLAAACGQASLHVYEKPRVRLPGGDLIIEWRGSDDHVLMTGPVEYEGAFILDEALFEAAAP